MDLPTGELTNAEVEALTAAASWYAKYHHWGVDELAADRSAAAESRRQHFADLHGALRKLGVKLRLPEGVELRA